MIHFFTDIFTYHHLYNQVVIDFLLNHPQQEMERSRAWMAHIVEAHHIWLDRMEGLAKLDVNIDQINVWKSLDQENHNRSLKIIENDSLDRWIHYRNSTGDLYVNTVTEILYHIVNHTSHHRGMIISDIRRAGMDPPVTDYIFYKR